MPTARLDQDVFAAGGTVATDWAQAGGNAQVSVAAGAQVRRGLNLDLGIQALASVDASLPGSKRRGVGLVIGLRPFAFSLLESLREEVSKRPRA